MKNIHKINNNIYITNDEEIKEGDWILDLDLKKAIKADSLKVITSTKSKCWYYKKIILTTDATLIVDGVQAIDDEFLEWFVKNPSCEWVDAKYKYWKEVNNVGWYEYKIIIPQEEPKKYTEEDMINFAFDTYYYISGIMKVPFNKISENRTHAEDNFKVFINSLNKQDNG